MTPTEITGISMPPNPTPADSGDRQHHQGKKGHTDREPREDDGPPGRRHGHEHRLFVGTPVVRSSAIG